MKFIPVVLRSIVIISVFSGIIYGVAGFDNPYLLETTIEAIKECMAKSPAPWPDEWKKEYLETIRKEVDIRRDASHYTERLEILRKGFESYWGSFKKTTERSLFEVHCARIRWYTENLMVSEFPTDQERQKLHNQYTDLWDYATSSLLKQFPFLDPKNVEKAKADDLSLCYQKINAPLMPVYLRPMSDEQVVRTKQHWKKLRYARVDLLCRLAGSPNMLSEKKETRSSNTERDYELTKESLSQLLGMVWTVVPQRPHYYLSAIEKRNKALKRSFQSERRARLCQQRLERTRSRQLLQTEHISFLLIALLETPVCLNGAPSNIREERSLLGRQDKTMKGGGASELNNDL